MDNEIKVTDIGPFEPVLPMSEIQGLAVPGFAKPHQILLGLKFGDGQSATAQIKHELKSLSREITTARAALDDRREFRQRRMAAGRRYPEKQGNHVLMGIGFSHQGLLKLTPGARDIPSPAFELGLPARSALLGDPTDPASDGHPSHWVVGKPGEELDALIILAGEDADALAERADALVARLAAASIDTPYREQGDIRPDLPGHEHFGFDDGISQPGIRGRASQDAADFITERYIAPGETPEAWLFGRPGQDLVWPGELVIGFPKSSPDPLVAGVRLPPVPDWTQNGSFLVYRRLRQDVALFWKTMREQARELKLLPGYDKLTDERLAALLIGRWQSGAPVSRVPDADNPDLGSSTLANNNFRFDSDTAALDVIGFKDTFDPARADPAGVRCPWAAHIRKVNTRDSGSDIGGRESTYTRRLLRVGIPYGAPLHDKYVDEPGTERGLLFLSIQASIEDQFEFLQSRWMNDPSRPKMPGGHDQIVGQNAAPGQNRVRRCVLFGSGLEQAEFNTDAQWIVPTGGGYFFVPSIRALHDVLGG